MRIWSWLLLALGAALTVVAAPAATAGNLVTRSQTTSLAGQGHTRFERHRIFHDGFAFDPFAFSGSVIVPGQYLYGMMPPVIVLGSVDSQAAPPRPALEQPSVETTPEGVVIVRGPGSHHPHF
jgi:hypothetical protein